jgi:predicted AAA+ superfamily ATPase
LAELVAEFPAVLINGPRAAGKTTTARQVAAEEIRLDQPALAAVVQADPDAALQGRAEPLLLDEWQEVPDVIGAVKRTVDDDPRPGRFILTGSVRVELEHRVWPGTGRLVRLRMYGLAERELSNRFDSGAPSFLDRLVANDATALATVTPTLNMADYVALAVSGGFPDVRTRAISPDGRRNWLAAYLEQLLTRDAATVSPRADHQKLERYFEALALNNAGMPADTTLYSAAGINAKTAAHYDKLLADLFIAEQLPAWTTNRLNRLERRSKRYIVDPALATVAARVEAATILDDGDLLGRTLDAFVVAQLRTEVALAARPARLHHLRTAHGRHEIDVVAELPGGRIVALEIKATAAPRADDAKHLRWLRDELGDRFIRGAVLNTGPEPFELEDKILALPLSTLWS